MKLSKNINKHFFEVVSMIKQARYAAIKSVNAEQIKLYWQIGEYISKKLESAQWGEGVVDRWLIIFKQIILNLKGLLGAGYTGCGSFLKHTAKSGLCQQR